MTGINIAELAIYAILALPILYILIKHGPRGYLGWTFLSIFCTVRVVGNLLEVISESQGKVNIPAMIISSVGLSPLLAAASGVVHEARMYRNPKLNIKIEWIIFLLTHTLIVGGIGIIAVASISAGPNPMTASQLNSAKIGEIIFLLAYASVVAIAVSSLLPYYHDSNAPGYAAGSKLLFAVLLALIPIFIRLIYGVLPIFTQDADLNAATGSIGYRVALGMIPELSATLLFVTAGYSTLDIKQTLNTDYKRTYAGGDRQEWEDSEGGHGLTLEARNKDMWGSKTSYNNA